MRHRATWLGALVLAAGLTAGTAASSPASATTAKRAPVEQICTFQSNGDHCINRNAGGTGTGTPLDAWHQGSNDNDFTFLQLSSWCGGTGIVRNGENGILCPFRNGSGLNARYDGRPVMGIVRDSNFGRCAVIPGFNSSPGVALGNCGDQGYAWVFTSFSNVVSIGQSNWWWDNHGHPSNDPWWLFDLGAGNQLIVKDNSTYTWGCVPAGGAGNC